MFNKKTKTCLESPRGKHVLPDKWSKPIKFAYKIEVGSFGHTATEYKYIQTKTCELCGLVFITRAVVGSAFDEKAFEENIK